MFDFQLAIFPFDSSAISLTTAVLIGVWITVFFNLRFGWTLSGLVVPGYLAPLFITRPITTLVIFFEAMLTYLIVKGLCHMPRLAPYWSSFFGRDRFFVIVVVSVLVRAVFDGWLMPMFGHYLVEECGINFDYRNTLQSFGLIVVALIANYFWKPGLRKGLLPIATTVCLTILFIKFILVEYTNFNVGILHHMYNDLSLSLEASPKAYMIVIASAFIASLINLRYAWDFNGILIPALLGLLWYNPLKILVSGVECIVLYVLAILLLKTRLFRNVTMEGGTKLVFFFTICFLYRLVLCYTLPVFFPGMNLTDAFGLGYLLTTLMAIKAYDKKLIIRMLNATAQVSLIGSVTGSLIGFAFYCGPQFSLPRPTGTTTISQQNLDSQPVSVAEMIGRDKILLYKSQAEGGYLAPTFSELATFRTALLRLKRTSISDPVQIQQVTQLLGQAGFQLHVLEDRYFYLSESDGQRGRGLFLIDSQNRNGLNIQVPTPLSEGATVEASLCLFNQFKSTSLAIAGPPRHFNFDGAADLSLDSNTMFSAFQEVYGNKQPLQVRGYTENLKRRFQLTGIATDRSQLWIRDHRPADLNLDQLKSMTGSFDVNWNTSPTTNRLRDSTQGVYSELFMTESDLLSLVARSMIGNQENRDERPDTQVTECYLNEWLMEKKSMIVRQGTDAYVPATTEQMLFMDRQVVRPLTQLIDDIRDSSLSPTSLSPTSLSPTNGNFWESPAFTAKLNGINTSASLVDYRVTVLRDRQSGAEYLALSEMESERFKGWGTFVFRAGNCSPYVIEIPRPLYEFRSFDFGVNLFERTAASNLLIGGAHPRANRKGTADISKSSNRTNLFNLVRHVLFRQSGNSPLLVVQARAIQAPVDADIVMATDEGNQEASTLSPLKSKLLNNLTEDNIKIAFVDGSPDTAGYEIGMLLQATAVQISRNKEVVSLWLSPSLRSKFRDQSITDSLSAQFDACGLQSFEAGLWDHIQNIQPLEPHDPQLYSGAHELPEPLRIALESYVDTYDVVQLFAMVREFETWRFDRVLDSASGQAFLLLSHKDRKLPIIVNLTGFVSKTTQQAKGLDQKVIEAFVRSRTLFLEIDAR